MDEEINLLDVLHSMVESDRSFYQTLRFLTRNRETLMAAHQRNQASLMGLLRMQIAAASTNVTYTATIPITLPTGWNDPVVVHPTSAQINAATEEINDDAAAASNCSICQDSLSVSHIRLVHCGHTFHNTCIAEWFSRSVFCPMCRHDVREVDHPAPTSVDPIHTPPRVRNRLDAWLAGVHQTHHTEDTEESDEHHA
jgi:Ring finger domain